MAHSEHVDESHVPVRNEVSQILGSLSGLFTPPGLEKLDHMHLPVGSCSISWDLVGRILGQWVSASFQEQLSSLLPAIPCKCSLLVDAQIDALAGPGQTRCRL